MEFKKLNAPTLKELFVTEMENMILSGKLEIGEKLPPERELAKSMQVSRAVVNSGIAELERKGFLVVRPRIGTFVEDYRKNGSIETLVSIMHYNGGMLREKETRSVLETRIIFMDAAASLAIANASDEEIASLKPYVDALKDCDDAEEASRIIFQFSHELSYISGNSLLPLFFVSFKDLVCSLWVRFSRAYGISPLYESANTIYNYLTARDTSGVKDYIKNSTQQSIDGSRTFYHVL
jgi:DNA-binding FadR family transcriptional regulator